MQDKESTASSGIKRNESFLSNLSIPGRIIEKSRKYAYGKLPRQSSTYGGLSVDKTVCILYGTSFIPQNLQNITKKLQKLTLLKLYIIELVCQSNRILLFFATFLISHTFCRFRLVVDIDQLYTLLSKTILHIRNQYPKVNVKSQYRKISSI